jgi:hypothetical protein
MLIVASCNADQLGIEGHLPMARQPRSLPYPEVYRGSCDCRTRPTVVDQVEALAATDGTVRWF